MPPQGLRHGILMESSEVGGRLIVAMASQKLLEGRNEDANRECYNPVGAELQGALRL